MTDAERAVMDPVERIKTKCSQFWNEIRVCDAELSRNP